MSISINHYHFWGFYDFKSGLISYYFTSRFCPASQTGFFILLNQDDVES